MNVIFLDIDGVLNCELFYLERMRNAGIKLSQKRASNARHYNICPRCVDFLNTIIKENDAYVVISSSWRSDGDLAYWKNFMHEVDMFEADKRVIGKTPRGGHGSQRGNEIKMWIRDNYEMLGKHPYEFRSYVILDDDSDMLMEQRNNYINVDPYCGITPRTIYLATNIFNNAA